MNIPTKLISAGLFLAVGLATGCNDNGTVRVVPTSSTAPKATLPSGVQDNPNIPDYAKKAMMGAGNGPSPGGTKGGPPPKGP